jgi:hypothetical protein
MSAFLKYSQSRRALVKLQNPDMSNTDVSRLLGEMWRLASEREKRPYVEEEEERERALYKQDTAAFRAQMARIDAASRTRHDDGDDDDDDDDNDGGHGEKAVVWKPPAMEIWNLRDYTTESSGSHSMFRNRLETPFYGQQNVNYHPHSISYTPSFPQGTRNFNLYLPLPVCLFVFLSRLLSAPSFDSFADSIPQGSFALDHDLFLEDSLHVLDESGFLGKTNRFR